MDIDEELVDYQEEDEEMMALDGTATKPAIATGKTVTAEDGDAIMVEEESVAVDGGAADVGTESALAGDVPMKPVEEVLAIDENEGDAVMVDGEDGVQDTDIEDVIPVDVEGSETGTTSPAAETAFSKLATTTDTPFPITVPSSVVPLPINGTAIPIPLPTATSTSLAADPTILPPGMPITGADVGLASTSIVPSWPPPPDAIPPVPSRLPDAASVSEALATDEAKLNVTAGEVGAEGIDVEVASVVAEAPGSPGKMTMALVAPGETFITEQEVSAHGVVESDDLVIDSADAEEHAEKEAGHTETEAESTGEVILPEAGDANLEDGHPGGEGDVEEYAEGEEGDYVEGEDYEGDEGEYYGEDIAQDGEAQVEEDHVEDARSPPLGAETIAEVEDRDELNGDAGQEGDESDDSFDGPPAIMLAISESDVRPLFESIPRPVSEDSSEEKKDGETEIILPVLNLMGDVLYKAPLSEIFVALRVALRDVFDEDEGTELVLFEKDLGLRIGEDNRHADVMTLCNLVELHQRCNCPEPITFFIEQDQARFISKYQAIKQVLDEAEGKVGTLATADGVDAGGEEETELTHGESEQGEGVDGEYEEEEAYEEYGEEQEHQEAEAEHDGDGMNGDVGIGGLAHELDGETEQEQIEASIDDSAAEANHAVEIDPNDAGIERSDAHDASTLETEGKQPNGTAAAASATGDKLENISDAYGIDGIIRGAETHAETESPAQATTGETSIVVEGGTEELLDYDEEAGGTRTPAKQRPREPSGTKRGLEEPDSPSRQVKRKLSGDEGPSN